MDRLSTQPQARQDPITKEWVIIARNRAKKPSSFIKNSLTKENSEKNQKNNLKTKL